jgi:hypothetical protein
MAVAFFVLALAIGNYFAVLFSNFEVNGFWGRAEIVDKVLGPAIIATKGHADIAIFYTNGLATIETFNLHVVPPIVSITIMI